MKVVSVNVGLPRQIVWKGRTVETGIYKQPVDGPVAVGEQNPAGDRQADLTGHGGPQKAVYAYQAENYDYWRKELPDVPLSWGAFGENLTTQGLKEDRVFIGDRMRVGTAVLMVTQPRMPCYKLEVKFQRDYMIKRFLLSGRSGFYFSVIEPGEVSAEWELEILERDPNRVTVIDIVRLYLGQTRDADLLERAVGLNALPQSWRDHLLRRAQAIG